MIKKSLESLVKILKLTIMMLFAFKLIAVVGLTGLHTKSAYQTISKEKLKKYSRSTNPLLTVSGQRYCSSSHIKYKRKVFTVTNNHCCEAYSAFEKNTIRVGKTLEKIIYRSPLHDVCVLTASNVDLALPLATKDVEIWDSVLMMGYPRGYSLTPSVGTMIFMNVPVRVGDMFSYSNFISHEALMKVKPGNSGSPILNRKGQVVGLAYATYLGDIDRGILVPYRYLKEALYQAYKVN